MNKMRIADFIEVPTIPNNFALIYIRSDAESAEFFVDKTKVGKLGNYDYTCFLVKKGEYSFYAKDAHLLATMWDKINIKLEGGKIYNFHCEASYSEYTNSEIKMKHGPNAKMIIERFNFYQAGSEKDNIRYNYRPPLAKKIEF